ncbi:hypothetical protein HID58_060377 [Brassica napus]|uniref:Uncharacterized protein n=1 Tax=Brassica napus TaxID=3708 RepID=A0ABQ7ZVJ2_BRANA|nr:hypothetical protein HID58_060377 [Brassica napus]
MLLLLDLHEDDGVKMVAISGPAGIGKTTIARALHSLIRDRFQLTCFVENRKGSYPPGLDDYVFFNYKDGDLVKAISADADHLEVKCGLKILANRSLCKREKNSDGTGVVSGISFDVSNGASSSSKVPLTFHPGYLVELDMTCTQLEIPLAGSSGYSGSFKCYKFGDVKSERVPEIGRDSVLLFASS